MRVGESSFFMSLKKIIYISIDDDKELILTINYSSTCLIIQDSPKTSICD